MTPSMGEDDNPLQDIKPDATPFSPQVIEISTREDFDCYFGPSPEEKAAALRYFYGQPLGFRTDAVGRTADALENYIRSIQHARQAFGGSRMPSIRIPTVDYGELEARILAGTVEVSVRGERIGQVVYASVDTGRSKDRASVDYYRLGADGITITLCNTKHYLGPSKALASRYARQARRAWREHERARQARKLAQS